MARPLPKKGFYVWSVHKWVDSQKLTDEQKARVFAQMNKPNVVYCSGTTKGNFYYDPAHHGDQWNFLTWTCVPSVKSAAAEYDYHETNPTDKPLPEEI
jgi:hypothetical protein